MIGVTIWTIQIDDCFVLRNSLPYHTLLQPAVSQTYLVVPTTTKSPTLVDRQPGLGPTNSTEILPIAFCRFTVSKSDPQEYEHGLHGLETMLKGGFLKKHDFCWPKVVRISFQIPKNLFPNLL